jgi:hypothetical protein
MRFLTKFDMPSSKWLPGISTNLQLNACGHKPELSILLKAAYAMLVTRAVYY